MELAKRADIAVFTIGAFGENSALVREGFLSEELMWELKQQGAVGDICTHVITETGDICDPALDQRTIAVSLENMKQMRYRVGVAQGISKVDAIRGALNSGIMNVLVTNDFTAEHILGK
jgi:deoxyribonucleoside regulator